MFLLFWNKFISPTMTTRYKLLFYAQIQTRPRLRFAEFHWLIHFKLELQGHAPFLLLLLLLLLPQFIFRPLNSSKTVSNWG